MRVFLLKDIKGIGIAGEIVPVSNGFWNNFMQTRKLGVKITPANAKFYEEKAKVVENRKSVIESNTSMLAEKIKGLTITIKHKVHDDGKLYASVNGSEVAEELLKHGVSIAKNQVEFAKSIKKVGTHLVTIKLSSKLKPQLKLKIISGNNNN